MIQGKTWAPFGTWLLPKLYGRTKNGLHAHFSNFLDVAVFLALFEGFYGGCGPPTQRNIGS